MSKAYLFLVLFCICHIQGQAAAAFFPPSSNTSFVVVTTSYNNREWCVKNVESVVLQKYTNWEQIIVDDCSTDGTGSILEQYIQQNDLQNKVHLVRNSERKGAMENFYNAISQISPEKVVVIVDGDDWLHDDKVLSHLARVYKNKKIWMTYGNYISHPSKEIGRYCESIPRRIVKNGEFRKYKWVTSHLRTFYAKLFHRINKAHFQHEGKFFPTTCDLAMMFPMLEQSRNGHFRFIRRLMLTYNQTNPINDYKVHADKVAYYDRYIRSLPRYRPLKSLFLKTSKEMPKIPYIFLH